MVQLVNGAHELLLLAIARAVYETWKHHKLIVPVCYKMFLTVAEFGVGPVASCVCA